MKKRGSEIFSIFGQIEEAVALSMLKEGKGLRIEPEDFPDANLCPEIHVNDAGKPAKFAIHMTQYELREFKRRVTALCL